MAARDGSDDDHSGSELWYLVPAGLIMAVVIVVVMIVSALTGSGSSSDGARAEAAAIDKLPPYWVVKPGQTYTQIAEKTGLSIDQLETFNPYTDPGSLVPGQRVKLRLHEPTPRSKPLGPRFWTVRAGQSFGSIAAATGKQIDAIILLNPRLKPTDLRPGDRVRLRR